VWLDLTEKHKLYFVPAYFPSQHSTLSGTYRDFFLEMKTVDGTTLATIKYSTQFLEQVRQHTAETPANLITLHYLVDILTTLNNIQAYDMQIAKDGQIVSCTIRNSEISLTELETFLDTQIEVIEAYTPLIAIGGEAIKPLRYVMVKHYGQVGQLAAAIIHAIGIDTTRRLAHKADRLLCSDCLTRFENRRVKMIGEKNVTYYGCRTCGQSRRYFAGRVVLVLDRAMQDEQTETERTLHLNWLQTKRLADVHLVNINQASDQDVERLVMQVHNDTTPGRRAKYAQLTCNVDPRCQLTENSLRLLRQTFKQIKQMRLITEEQ
jgi:RNase P subunit RPR2